MIKLAMIREKGTVSDLWCVWCSDICTTTIRFAHERCHRLHRVRENKFEPGNSTQTHHAIADLNEWKQAPQPHGLTPDSSPRVVPLRHRSSCRATVHFPCTRQSRGTFDRAPSRLAGTAHGMLAYEHMMTALHAHAFQLRALRSPSPAEQGRVGLCAGRDIQ